MRGDLRWFLLLLLTFAYFHQGGFANSNARFDLSLSIALGHRYDIDPLAFNTIDRIRIGSHYYSEKAPGTAYAALPVALAASPFLTLGELTRHPGLAEWLFYLATVASAGLLSAIAAVAFRRLLSRLQPARSHLSCWLITSAVFLGTPVFGYSTMLFGHAIAAAWLVIGLYAGLVAARLRSVAATRYALIASLALGLAVLTEYPTILPAAAIALGLLAVARRPGRLLLGAPAALVPVGLLMLHQYAAYGSPFTVGYGKLAGTQFATGMSRGFFGIGLPDPTAAAQLLFGTYRGLFVYAPVLTAGVLGFAFWPRLLQRRLAPALLGGAAALWLAIASYTYWQGGPAFGPRHLVPAIPLLGLGLAFWPRGRSWNAALSALAAVSVAVNLVGTATTPFVSEFIPDPIVSVYPRLAAAGAMSINPVSFLTPASEVDARWEDLQHYPRASFNLGELAGLRGWSSLLPLAAVWLLVARRSGAAAPRREAHPPGDA
jgi:hypothetical protein